MYKKAMEQAMRNVLHSKDQLISFAVLMVMSLCLIATMVNITVTYEVTDGTTTHTIHTTSQDQTKILSQLGFTSDDYKITINDVEGTNITHMTLEQKFDVNVTVDGATHTVYTASTELSDILDELSITLSDLDEISHDTSSMITEATDVNIVRVQTEIITETEVIPYDTVKRSTSRLTTGQTEVITEGQDGELVRTLEVVTRDGVEVSREITSEITASAPVSQVVEYGTGGTISVARSSENLRYSQKIEVVATAYSTEGWSNNITATGTVARVGAIAVDPNVIPLGSRLYITSPDGKSWVYGYATAEDTGGSIKGNKIDLFFNTQAECIQFGKKSAIVYVLD